MNNAQVKDKTDRRKFTTTLSAECINELEELMYKLKLRTCNKVIEHLVKEEINKYEVGKKRNFTRDN